MTSDRERAMRISVLASDLREVGSDLASTTIKALCSLLIEQVRAANDTVEAAELAKNQGEIAAYQKIMGFFERGLPNI